MLEITKEHLDKVRKIKKQFLLKTKVPSEDNWKSWRDNDIWLHLVTQVIVIGGSAPSIKFEKSQKLKRQIAFERLAGNLPAQTVRREK